MMWTFLSEVKCKSSRLKGSKRKYVFHLKELSLEIKDKS